MPSNPPKPGFAAFRADTADAFDLWLRDDLQRLYSAVAAEPVPPELLRLLDGATEAAVPAATGPPLPPARHDGMADPRPGFERRVRERAYFLWLEEDCPEGRAAEHWRLASAIQAGHEAGHGADGKARRGGRQPFRAGRI